MLTPSPSSRNTRTVTCAGPRFSPRRLMSAPNMLVPPAKKSGRISMLLPCAAQSPLHISDGYGELGSGASKVRLRTSPAASTSSRYVIADCDVVTSTARPLYGRTRVQPRQPVEVSVDRLSGLH